MNLEQELQELRQRVNELERDERVLHFGGSGAANAAAPFAWEGQTTPQTNHTVTIGAGKILTPSGYREVASLNVEVTGGTEAAPQYIYMEIRLTGDVGHGAIAERATASEPVSDVNFLRVVLHEAYRNGDAVLQKKPRWQSDFPMVGYFA
jgi:hypothetical protein